MPTVTEDMATSPRIEEDKGTFNIVRVFRVKDLVTAKEFQLMEALDQAGIPAYLDPYPFSVTPEYPAYSAGRVKTRTVEPDGPNAARVTIVYTNNFGIETLSFPVGNDGADVKQVRSSVASFKTTTDRAAADMTINPPSFAAGRWKAYLSEAEVLRPVGTLVFERYEASPPTARMRTYVGTLNSATIGPYAAETLLFANYDATNDANDGLWRVVYEFQYSSDGWQHTDRYHAPDGKVPEGAAEVSFDVIETSNFSLLGLDFTD